MLKKIFATAAFLSITTINAQNLNDYTYFYVLNQSTDFSNNQYQLHNRIKYYLGKKNFTILTKDKSTWTNDITTNPCKVVNIDIEKAKSMLTNKLEIKFIDCNNNLIKKFEGKSNIKEFEKGYQDALLKALNSIENHNYSEKKETSIPNLSTTEEVNRVEPFPVIKDENSFNPIPTTNKNEGKKEPHPVIKDEVVYDNNLKKVDLKDGGFLLMNKISMQTVAQFEPTLRPIIYRVTVFTENGNKYSSVGYTEGNSISFEYLDNKEWKVKTMKL